MSHKSNGRAAGAPMTDLSNGRRAVNAPGSAPSVQKTFLPEGELWRIGGFPILLVRTAERIKESLDSGDTVHALVWSYWFFKFACVVDHFLVHTTWDTSKVRFGFLVEIMTLQLRWKEIKRGSGLENLDLTREDAFECVEFDWPGHEAVYRSFAGAALRLLEAIGKPMQDPGPIPFAPKPEADGRAPKAPADWPELVTAPPSENGTTVPSWNKETMTLSYRGRHVTLRADAATRSDVFNWFESAGWRKVKIPGLDIVHDAGQVSNLVRRAKATARRVGFVITRAGEELAWKDQG